jgi:NAD-dependent SIR2 family protein deacetylase
MPNAIAPDPDYSEIAKRLKDGTIVPFFGAGASISCGLPSGRALAERLVARAEFPDESGRDDLALVASYLVQKEDSLTLRDELRQALDRPTQPGRLHRCLASPRFDRLSLFVTTNYDDLIERALEPRAPWVVVDRGTPGIVWIRSQGEPWDEVETKNLGYRITDRSRPIVLKLHGSLDSQDRDSDSFLITEDHYVDFLGRAEGGQIPQMLATVMRQRSFLFLGYGLKDWNIRVLLRKLAQARGRSEKIRSWAIVRKPGKVEPELWGAQNIDMLDVDLDEFVTHLEAHL